MDSETRSHLKESPGVVWLPLVLLAIPSVAIAWFSVEPMLFGSFFDGAVFVLPENNSLIAVSDHFHGVVDFAIHGFQTVPFWLMVSGAICGYVITRYNDAFKPVKKLLSGPRWILDHKYGFDQFNQAFFANGSVKLGQFFNRLGEQIIIDGGLVNGSAKVIGALAGVIRRVQTGYLYHYAFVMMAGLFAFVFWYYWRT